MSNVCEPLHHRNKRIAYGYLQAIAKMAGSQDSSLFFRTTRMQHCRWMGGL
ncbi:hypothetical protein NXX54_23705 [Bacteroides sp. BFG-638]|uniref:Uncharacterized protein n=1 Tax=Bacteroides vicugnae TaxID=3037989 RepID=A0ABU5HWV9_9BACE|nr:MULTISPECIES: hypothetical protein [Bacteroides]MCS2582820.1 hypothetical protein [Bacteroides sp. BFG-551]MEB3374041.1 hypothetical protein [Bacteroides sp. CR5/BHMF/2]MCE8925309.1 hypothetical protein [Bacteroides ovatus]MCS2333576.1 hypothetical protein [Bacteroides sp. BFG-606]MCS2334054.1 hypothetical protein [Bacteroides sp. BFG-606]